MSKSQPKRCVTILFGIVLQIFNSANKNQHMNTQNMQVHCGQVRQDGSNSDDGQHWRRSRPQPTLVVN